MILAALQFAPRRAEPEQNLECIRSLTDGLRCDLLVLPELASTGYFFVDRRELLLLAESGRDGAFCAWMRRTASERSMIVVGGFAERDDGDRLYNSALIALPDGRSFIYRKTHLFYKEKLVFEPGDTGFFVVEHGGARIGAMICYDWRFPEAARTLALRGADVIAHPSNLVAAASLWSATVCTRAFENKAALVTANRRGTETLLGETLSFSGCSQITGMNGAVLSRADASQDVVITAAIDPQSTRKKSLDEYNDIFADRRPEMYE